MMTAAVGEPGTPSVTIGRIDPRPAAFAADWGASTPSSAPFPNRSGSLEYWRARP